MGDYCKRRITLDRQDLYHLTETRKHLSYLGRSVRQRHDQPAGEPAGLRIDRLPTGGTEAAGKWRRDGKRLGRWRSSWSSQHYSSWNKRSVAEPQKTTSLEGFTPSEHSFASARWSVNLVGIRVCIGLCCWSIIIYVKYHVHHLPTSFLVPEPNRCSRRWPSGCRLESLPHLVPRIATQ